LKELKETFLSFLIQVLLVLLELKEIQWVLLLEKTPLKSALNFQALVELELAA
jgi:hypothetical protein